MGYSGFLKTLMFSNYQKEQKMEKGDCAADISTVIWVQIPVIHMCSYDVRQCEVSNLNESLNLFDPTTIPPGPIRDYYLRLLLSSP
jgi:hypothetical protein